MSVPFSLAACFWKSAINGNIYVQQLARPTNLIRASFSNAKRIFFWIWSMRGIYSEILNGLGKLTVLLSDDYFAID